MADIKTPEARSLNMSKIRSRDTKPEVWLRKQLFSRGYRYRKNASHIPGHPDLWMTKYNTAIFVHGCFWHRHQGCKYAYHPKSRAEFWEVKFRRNMERDRKVETELSSSGIRMLIIWECAINAMMKSEEKREAVLSAIEQFLSGNDDHFIIE